VDAGADTSAAQTCTITITGVTEVLAFVKGADQTVLEDAGAQSVAWATGINAGPGDGTQGGDFLVSTTDPRLWSSAPAGAANGTLTFTPAANAIGSATVTVRVHDDGGIANGGVDNRAPQTFTITVTSVKDAPSFVKGANQNVLVGFGAQTVSNWATSLSAGPSDENGQALNCRVNTHNS